MEPKYWMAAGLAAASAYVLTETFAFWSKTSRMMKEEEAAVETALAETKQAEEAHMWIRLIKD